MLPKAKRLNLSKDFKWVASGKKVETEYVRLFIRFGQNDMPSIGIAPSGKFFKKATERNRAKRLVSQAFEVLYNDLPKSINIIALPKQGVLKVKLTDIFSDLEKVLKNKHVILSD